MQKILLVCSSTQGGAPDDEFQPELQLPQTSTELPMHTELRLKWCSSLQPLEWQKLKQQPKTPTEFNEHTNKSRGHHQAAPLCLLFIISPSGFKAVENLVRITYIHSAP